MNLSFATSYLLAKFANAGEFQNIFMAVQGAMNVRNGPNKDGKMKWFHAFAQGVVMAFAGGLMAPLWMGRPTPMLAKDLAFGSCIFAYILVNCTPLDIGYKILSLLPFKVLTVMGAQLFRNRGIVSFNDIAYNAFKDSPSKYYPTPVFGPILNACILGNMGGFFFKGFHGHLKNGMPWAFQNGIFVASTYHFVANDQGPIGEYMRNAIKALPVDMEPALLVSILGSLFMQVVGILQMPDFCGPSFNPFSICFAPFSAASQSESKAQTTSVKAVEEKVPSVKAVEVEETIVEPVEEKMPTIEPVEEKEPVLDAAAAKRKKKNQKKRAAQKKKKAALKEKEL